MKDPIFPATVSQIVAHLAELPASNLIDLQLVVSLCQGSHPSIQTVKDWGSYIQLALEQKQLDRLKGYEEVNTPIGI